MLLFNSFKDYFQVIMPVFKKKVSVTRKYHNYKLQTNQQHHKEEKRSTRTILRYQEDHQSKREHRGSMVDFLCLIWLFVSQSKTFQLCQNGSSWVERVLDLRPRCRRFGLYWRYCGLSLSKTHLALLSTGSTHKDLFRHNWKIVDWDTNNQTKQTKSKSNNDLSICQ